MDKIAAAQKGRKNRSVGIDFGVRSLVTLSNGVKLKHHPSLTRLRYNLSQLHDKLARQEPNSRRWKETLRLIAKTELQIERCQRDYAAKLANTLCRHYRTIIIEEIHIGETIERNDDYFDAVRDARWDLIVSALRHKCAETHRTLVEVKPFFTSQDCSRCGTRNKLAISDRWYHCPACGLEIDRDINAAVNIRKKGIAKLERQQKARESHGFPPY